MLILHVRTQFVGETEALAKAEAVLQRLKIIRVFDFVGAVEAVDEIQRGLEGPPLVKPTARTTQRERRIRTGQVPDSEDEEEDSPPALEDIDTNSCIGMVIIDNLTSVVNPLIKGNHVQG